MLWKGKIERNTMQLFLDQFSASGKSKTPIYRAPICRARFTVNPDLPYLKSFPQYSEIFLPPQAVNTWSSVN